MVSNTHRNCPCPTPEEDELDEAKMPRPDLPRRANSLHAKFLRDLPQCPGEIQSPQKEAEELWESDNAPLQASNLIARSRPWLAESFKYPNADMVFGDMLKLTPLPTDGYMAYSRPPTPGSLTELAGVESSAGTSHPRRQSLYPATPINSETPKRSAKSTISTNSRSSTISSGSRDSAIGMLPEDRDNLSGRAYLCELCSSHFSSSSKLSRHRKEHANPTCIYCGELKTEDLRKQHYATCHKHLCFGLTGGNDDSVSVPRNDTISPYGDVAVIRDLAYFQSESYSTEPKSYMQGVGSMENVYSKSLNLFDTSPITREVDSYRSIIQSNQISKDSLLHDPALRLDLDCTSPSKICEEEIQSAVIDPAARLDTDSSFSEYETDLEDEETIDDSPDIDFSKVSQTWHESPESARGEVISRVLTPMQQALLDQMMTEFWVIFKQEIDSFPKELTCPIDDTHQDQTQELVDSQEGQCGSNTEQPISRTEFATPISTLTSASALKRKRGKEKDEGDENDDERNPKQPRELSYVPADAETHLKFACPYRKNNPVKYSVREWRSCALTPLDTVARVKAHLYRHHRIFPCQRCKTLFKSQEEVNEHQKEPEPCLLTKTELGDGLTSEIVEKMKSRKKSDKNQTESERWREIYKLLFPQDLVPDPYFEAVQENLSQSPDSRELENYEVFCRQELPRSVRHALEELIRSQSSPIEEILRNQLVSIIRDCQDRVFSRYRESLGPAGGSPIRTRTGSVSSTTISSTAAPPKALSNDAKASESTATKGSVLTFLQPPPPQNDLGSQKICDTVLKPAAANHTSDSGYTSSSDPPPPASPRINRRSSLFPLNPLAPPSEPAPEQPLPANPWPNPPVFDKQCAEDEHSSPLMDGLGGSGYFPPVDSELYDLFDKGADVEYSSPSIQGLDGTSYIPPVDQGLYDASHDPDNYEWASLGQ